MSDLFKLKTCQLLRDMPTSLQTKNSRDDHLLNWMWLYALILVALFYVWEHYSMEGGVPLQMTAAIAAKPCEPVTEFRLAQRTCDQRR